jgi:NAD-dependent dihydropyrimidine dehydrogenase PreA subunit
VCEFCIQHGEGKKWYLQANNYSKELLNCERLRYIFSFANNIEGWSTDWPSELDKLIIADPSLKSQFIAKRTKYFKRVHYGQVVPLEEIEQILDMTISIIRLPCICRSALWDRYDARYCFGVTTSIPLFRNFFGLYPDFSPDLEVLTKEKAKKTFQDHDKDGLVHTVWTFITPFIGVVCNCTSKDCLPLKWRLGEGLNLFFKAEYVASINWDNCIGCKDCMKACNFGAISYSAPMDKCQVNQLQCYGCGVCRAVCPYEAITLQDRNAIPLLAEDW